MNAPPFKYNWSMAGGYPAAGIECHHKKVFGTFICGGGSTMGYKLGGYDHMGGVEIEDAIADIYEANHHPRFLFREDIKAFNRSCMPPQLSNLDVLDGSPPCSSFSMAGNREDDWGKEKVFNEGQKLQRLDDLFFDFIDTAEILKPKVVVAENVTGLVNGNARAYVHDICKRFDQIGYKVQVFRLNAASMGVPQKRERIFFLCRKKELKLPDIKMVFNQRPIFFHQLEDQISTSVGKPISEAFRVWWEKCKPGNSLSSVHPNGSFFNTYKVWKNQVCPTVTSTVAGKILHYSKPAEISIEALRLIGSFPQDYNFLGVDPKYIIGMSVPPVMMAQVSYQIYNQWLKLV